MPQTPEPTHKPEIEPSLDLDDYPGYAYSFVHEGLAFTVMQIHGKEVPNSKQNRHVSGQQLCQGIADLARARWGRMARTVLRRWNVTTTLDFGRIVYSMIAMGQLQKVEEDSIDDFKNVYDFETAFETSYKIPAES